MLSVFDTANRLPERFLTSSVGTNWAQWIEIGPEKGEKTRERVKQVSPAFR